MWRHNNRTHARLVISASAEFSIVQRIQIDSGTIERATCTTDGDRMRRLFTCVLLSLALPAAAQTPDWQLISQSGNRGQVINWYVDASSIVRTDDYLRAVLRTSWSAPQYGPDQTAYQSSTYLNYFDCGKRMIAYTGNTYYRNIEPVGLPVHEEPELPLAQLMFQEVTPGSAGETRLDFVCKFRSKQFMT
ncbi:MAG: hypothetical protein RL369_126 [Pseudomonadota bacterium]